MEFRGLSSDVSVPVTSAWTLTVVQHLWSCCPLLYIKAVGPGDRFAYLSRVPFPYRGAKD